MGSAGPAGGFGAALVIVAQAAAASEAPTAVALDAAPAERPEAALSAGAVAKFTGVPHPLYGVVVAGEHELGPSWLSVRGGLAAASAWKEALEVTEYSASAELCAASEERGFGFGFCLGAELRHLVVQGYGYTSRETPSWLALKAAPRFRWDREGGGAQPDFVEFRPQAAYSLAGAEVSSRLMLGGEMLMGWGG